MSETLLDIMGVLGVIGMVLLFLCIIWMAINNDRISRGYPKIHIHRYVPSWGLYNLKVCKYKNCTRWKID